MTIMWGSAMTGSSGDRPPLRLVLKRPQPQVSEDETCVVLVGGGGVEVSAVAVGMLMETAGAQIP